MVTARQVSGPSEAPAAATRTAPPATGHAGTEAAEVEDDILVEDIVIDGMCGVY
jgi:mycofactocin precursor